MKKTLTILIITGAFIFALCNQSILINKKTSNIPFTPNIFVSPSGVEKTMTLDDAHSGSYVSKLNDSPLKTVVLFLIHHQILIE